MKQEIQDFVNKWKKKPDVIGIVISGSYATGLSKKESDVDARIIIKTNNTFCKGVESINGIPFSFILGNIEDFLSTIHSQFFNNLKFEARVFYIGNILLDKTGEIQSLKEKAGKIIDLDFESISTESLVLRKYMLHNNLSYFSKTSNSSLLFNYHYFQFLSHIFKAYSSYLCFEVPNEEKLETVLFDQEYQEKNFFKDFPDKEFMNLWLKAIQADKKNFKSTCNVLYEHVQEAWGSFNANAFLVNIK